MKRLPPWFLAVLLLCVALPAHAGWFRAETPAFVLYGQGSARLTAGAATQLAAFDALLRQLTGAPADTPRARVNVYLVTDPGDIDRLTADVPWAAGFYVATPNNIVAVVNGTGIDMAAVQHVLFHEYAHHFMFAHTNGNYPAWYVEGLASYWETARFSGGKARFGDYDQSRAQTLSLASWMPMARVIGTDFANLPGNELPMFYAQSWLMVHYFASDPQRAAALARYLAAVGAGAVPATAFAETFGFPVERFDKMLIDYVMGNTLRPTELAFTAPPAIGAAALSPVADALLVPSVQLDIGVSERAAPALLDRVTRIAARTPDDLSAQTVLAIAELRLAGPALARSRIDSLLLAAPDNARLLLLQGEAQRSLGETDAAATLARADALRPDDYRILYQRALAQPLDAAAERRALLTRANALAPQVDVIALAAAEAAVAVGDYAAARALLAPIVNNPHGDQAAARALLQRLPEAPPIDGAIKAAPPK